MSKPENTPNDEKYEGVPKPIEVLGKSSAYGWGGTLTGAAVGAAFSGTFIKDSDKWSQKITDAFKTHLNWNISGKTALVIAGAYIASKIGHYIGIAYGFHQGSATAGKGEAQFERIKTERNDAQAELATLKEQVGAINETLNKTKHTDSIKPREGTHADAALAEKEQATEIAR